ncbi:MAG: CoA ester lyase, partial [Pseudomonadota bacterium]
MPAIARPRRSVLYMPGSRSRALEKARALPADALILDLEDAVIPEEKTAARDLVCAALAEGGYGARELIVRVNGLDTTWGAADIEAAAKAGPEAILVPKVESPEMIRDVADRMTAAGAPDHTAIWAMMETPRGVLASAEIAASHEKLTGYVMGTNDLVKELRAEHAPGRAPVLASLSMCLLAARAHGLVAIDGVYNAFK